MTIGNVNGHPVFVVTRKEVNYTPSAFIEAYETWEEGTKQNQLSAKQLTDLKEKYNTNKMSDKDVIQLFGDLVRAGVMSKGEALDIYNVAAPLDVSNYDGTTQGTLKACSGREQASPSYNGFSDMSGDKGYDYYKAELENIKEFTNTNPEENRYFQTYDRFLQIMEQLRREQILKQ